MKSVLLVLLMTSVCHAIETIEVPGGRLVSTNIASISPATVRIVSSQKFMEVRGNKIAALKREMRENIRETKVGRMIDTTITTNETETVTEYPLMFSLPEKVIIPPTKKIEIKEIETHPAKSDDTGMSSVIIIFFILVILVGCLLYPKLIYYAYGSNCD